MRWKDFFLFLISCYSFKYTGERNHRARSCLISDIWYLPGLKQQ